MESDDPELKFFIQSFAPNRHERSGFRSGVARIDNFLKRTSRKHQAGDFARIWVACRPGGQQVLGYYAINAHALEVHDLPPALTKGAPRHGSVPGAYLSMVGVDVSVQGHGLGRALVVDALRRIEAASRTIGIKAVVLDVIDDGAIGIKAVVLDVIDDGGAGALARRMRFYGKLGFVSFPSRPTRMFIAMATVRTALGGGGRGGT